MTEGSEFESQYDQEFSNLHDVLTSTGAQPLKWPGREADHSHPDSAEVKKYGSIHPLVDTSS
ncbi:hypothetical protein B7P43_G13695 [Cryptotermes secundus]|uniref:Uncharacterized protein n=1 Tax=Cryptotermes secundus TaxID=105785 RepID=A0A2J7PVH7_9NEOP|nr:hypothetical protein B7P43_G13695 [Cryptotermes secundus]